MSKWKYDDHTYIDILWQLVRQKAEKEAENGVKEALQLISDEILKQENDDQTISVSQLKRYRSKDSGDRYKMRDGKKDMLSRYAGYKDYADFRTRVDAGAVDENPAAAQDERDVYGRDVQNPDHHNIPSLPDYFVGRSSMLQEIHDKLIHNAQRQSVVLLSSMGGMGKTTVMHEYLNRSTCRVHFDCILYISVNKDLERAFVTQVQAALQLNLADILPEKKVDSVVSIMKAMPGNNLLAIDNINEYDYNDLVAMQRFFKATGWRVLITTRTQPDEGFDPIEVNELDMPDATLLFLYHYAPDKIARNEMSLRKYMSAEKMKAPIESLLDYIGRHTLFTELLAKAGRKKGISPTLLLQYLEEQHLKHPGLERMLTPGQHAVHAHKETNVTTLRVYMLGLFDTDYLLKEGNDATTDQNNKAKVTMLRYFSMLPTEYIPVQHLKKLCEVNSLEENAFEDRLDELKQSGWIRGRQLQNGDAALIQNHSYSMHPLVQKIVFERLKPDGVNCSPLLQKSISILSGREKRALGNDLASYVGYATSIADKLLPGGSSKK